MTDLTLNKRIKEIYEWCKVLDKGFNQRDFADKIGLSYTTVNEVLNEKKGPGLNVILSISNAFIEINPIWLLKGEGEMLVKNNNNELSLTAKKQDSTVAPLISQYAYAGYLSGFGDHDYLDAQPQFTSLRKYTNGNYMAFEVRGDSMDDNTRRSICHGDILLGCELNKELWKYRLHIPKVFIIVHKSDGIICKEIIDHDYEIGKITCHSWNQNSDFSDFSLNLNDVLQLFYIKEISRDNKN